MTTKQNPTTLAEKVRFAQALITAGKHSLATTDRDVDGIDASITDLQAKRERLLKAKRDAPAMIRRGEEELERIQRAQIHAGEIGAYSKGASAGKLAKLVERREALMSKLAALQAEVEAAEKGGAS